MEKLKQEEEVLLKAQVGKDASNLLQLRDKLEDELKLYRAELVRKQDIVRKKERIWKEQHEKLVKVEEEYRRVNKVIYQYRAGNLKYKWFRG